MTADIAKLREALALVEAHDGKPDDHAFVHDITALMLDAYGPRYSEICGLYELACSGGLNALGAVVALVEREMQEADWSIGRNRFMIDCVQYEGKVEVHGLATCNPALALLAAYLRALIAEAEQAGQRAGKAS